MAQALKSPPELIDVFLKAVIRTQKPLSYDQLTKDYVESLHHIGPAELNLVAGQHLPLWPKILFRKEPIDAGLTT